MDSLKNESESEPSFIDGEHSTKPTSRNPNRIPIGDIEWQLLGGWLEQVNKASKGFLVLTRADVVGFLLRSHATEFSAKEISQIRMAYYDPIRHMQWIAPQLKVALEAGDHQKILLLQDELKQVEVSIVDKVTRNEPIRSEVAAKRKNKPRKQKNQDQIAAESSNEFHDLQSEIERK